MSASNTLNLVPPLVEAGKFNKLVKAGQTISYALSPADNSFAVYIKDLDSSIPDKDRIPEDEQPVYFANRHTVPSSERREFLTDTLIIFTAFQKLVQSIKRERIEDWLENEEYLEPVRKLSIDYVNFCKECWIHASQPVTREPLQFSAEHYQKLYTCFSLFVLLYLPEPGFEKAPVGEELLEWLNTHSIEPSTEEGDMLSSLEEPWEDEAFWPYVTRAIMRGLTKAATFFLSVLEKHPSEPLRGLIATLAPLIEGQPRLINFTAERDFVSAQRRWHDKVKALRIDMAKVPEDERFDEYENWWNKLSDIVGILEGRAEVIQRVCEDMGADWKEVCVAWSIFVDPRMRRDEVHVVVSEILNDMPPDPTDLEDLIHASLMAGQPGEALEHAEELDVWLAAHFADIMETIELIDADIDEDSGMSTRDYYVMAYADYLHSDAALWRITVDYMYSCGDIGTQSADEILVRVPLKMSQQKAGLDSRIRAGEVVGVLKDVNQTCFEYKREGVRRTVCRIAAQTLVAEKDYGLAVTYCTSAEDWRGLGRIVDRVLEEYITSGPIKFAEYALAIAPSINILRTQPNIQGVFIHRLLFAVRFARFHDLVQKQDYIEAASDLISIFTDDVAPTSWWAVVLCDAVPLFQYNQELLFSSNAATAILQKLDEIFIRTSQGAAEDYLPILTRVIRGRSDKDALDRLKVVRLALARYFARVLV